MISSVHSVLVVVAHPDDEVLGAGATIAALTRKNITVNSCILSGQVDARKNRPELPDLHADIQKAEQILCIHKTILGPFPNIEFNTVPHLQLVQFIEAAILETEADLIFTHHPGDLNNDHLHTSLACQAAARLFQRKPDAPRLRGLFFMEILSSTDWAFRSMNNAFQADTFFPAGETLAQKIAALQAYRGVMRDFPHPRSEEIVRGLAAYRGGQAGMDYAEAFQTAFHALGQLGGW
jgi:N-acetylglucosamine malate deacetylase 1